jgi:hypothetical protein
MVDYKSLARRNIQYGCDHITATKGITVSWENEWLSIEFLWSLIFVDYCAEQIGGFSQAIHGSHQATILSC